MEVPRNKILRLRICEVGRNIILVSDFKDASSLGTAGEILRRLGSRERKIFPRDLPMP